MDDPRWDKERDRRAAAEQNLAERKKQYLADAERGARLAFASLQGPDNTGTEKERVKRALKYAEWRWEGFYAGEITSL